MENGPLEINKAHISPEPIVNSEDDCLNCGDVIIKKYCGNCGQKKYDSSDKKISHLLEETSHSLTHFDGTFWTNLKTILLHPGKFSQEYCGGRKKKYYPPIAFFAILVILYLLFPMFEGLNMQLKYFRSNGLFDAYYNSKMDEMLTARSVSFEELSEQFHHLGEKTAKFLIITLIPVMAAFTILVTYRRRKYFYDHFIFATEALSFFILVFYLFVAFIFYTIRYFGYSLNYFSDAVISISLSTGFLVYVTIAARRFFAYKPLRAFGFSIVFVLFYLFYFQFIYKFFLFYIVMKIL